MVYCCAGEALRAGETRAMEVLINEAYQLHTEGCGPSEIYLPVAGTNRSKLATETTRKITFRRTTDPLAGRTSARRISRCAGQGGEMMINCNDLEICGHMLYSGECQDCGGGTETKTGTDVGCYCCGSHDIDEDQICPRCREAETVLKIRGRQ